MLVLLCIGHKAKRHLFHVPQSLVTKMLSCADIKKYTEMMRYMRGTSKLYHHFPVKSLVHLVSMLTLNQFQQHPIGIFGVYKNGATLSGLAWLLIEHGCAFF